MTSEITVIHKGTIFNICTLSIFIESEKPMVISYELRDDITKLPQTGWAERVRLLHCGGEFELLELPTPDNVEGLILQLLEDIKDVYLEESAAVYKEELLNGLRN
jgi:hypothetical protein